MRLALLFIFILFSNSTHSQVLAKTKIIGKINANSTDLEGICVINLRTEMATITQKDGYFSIDVLPGDTLLFSAIHLKEVRVVLDLKDFEKELFYVKMEPTITQLNEVVVRRYDNINAVSLGISRSGIIQLTQAERKLYTAQSANGDAILNLLSGRTAMLKKELVVEKKLSYIQIIDNMFKDEHFIKDFKIPTEYVNGFKYYVVENDQFTTILKQKNEVTIDFLLGELAIKYNQIIKHE